MRRAIIGGTGVYGIDGEWRRETVETPYGSVEVEILSTQGAVEIVFLPRHGKGHSVPPHQVNYRANMMALKQLGVTHVYATCAVGSCNPAYEPGDIVMLRDFVDFTKSRPVTFYEGDQGVGHADMSEPYCHQLKERFMRDSAAEGLVIKGEAIYVCTEGPRFETAAEIAFYARNGWDVVGMTNVPEVVLAKELGMCYSAIGLITNYCTGLVPDEPIGKSDILNAMAVNKERVTRIATEILCDETLNQDQCQCTQAVMIL